MTIRKDELDSLAAPLASMTNRTPPVAMAPARGSQLNIGAISSGGRASFFLRQRTGQLRSRLIRINDLERRRIIWRPREAGARSHGCASRGDLFPRRGISAVVIFAGLFEGYLLDWKKLSDCLNDSIPFHS